MLTCAGYIIHRLIPGSGGAISGLDLHMKLHPLFFLCAAMLPGVLAVEPEIPVFDVKQIDDIRAAEGKEIKVRGLIERTGRSKGTGINFLNFTGGEFMAVIFGRSLKNFPKGEPADIFKGKLVEVAGKVAFYKGNPQIVIEEPSRIVVLDQATRQPVAAPAERKPAAPEKKPGAGKNKDSEQTTDAPTKGKVDPRIYFDDP